jgi:hypothetical protein
MIGDDEEEGQGPDTGTVVEGEGRSVGQDAATFGMDDIRGDLKAGLRRKSAGSRGEAQAGTAAPDAPAPAPAALRDPLKAAYMIVGISALFTAIASAALLHLIGGPHLGPTSRWLAPLTGAGLFALLGVLLARSTVGRPQ